MSFLFPAGQFGTRIQGGPVLDSFQWARLDLRNDLCRFVPFCPSGKDAASARYIYTRLERQGPHEPVHCHQVVVFLRGLPGINSIQRHGVHFTCRRITRLLFHPSDDALLEFQAGPKRIRKISDTLT